MKNVGLQLFQKQYPTSGFCASHFFLGLELPGDAHSYRMCFSYYDTSVLCSARYEPQKNIWRLSMSYRGPVPISPGELGGFLTESGFDASLPLTSSVRRDNGLFVGEYVQDLPETPLQTPDRLRGARRKLVEACLHQNLWELRQAMEDMGQYVPDASAPRSGAPRSGAPEVSLYSYLSQLPFATGSQRVHSLYWLHRHEYLLTLLSPQRDRFSLGHLLSHKALLHGAGA